MNTVLIKTKGGKCDFAKINEFGKAVLRHCGWYRVWKPTNVCECSPEEVVVALSGIKFIINVAAQSITTKPHNTGHPL